MNSIEPLTSLITRQYKYPISDKQINIDDILFFGKLPLCNLEHIHIIMNPGYAVDWS